MKNLLTELLKKLGVEDYSQLTEVEKATYNEWQQILSHEVRIENVAAFLETQVKRLQKELMKAVQEDEDRQALIITAKIENYEAIIMFIKEPLERRKSLEQQLLTQVT